jgi:hypothetical protein
MSPPFQALVKKVVSDVLPKTIKLLPRSVD